jgi:hypothetical protein
MSPVDVGELPLEPGSPWPQALGRSHGGPASALPAPSRDSGSNVRVEESRPPAARKWSWPELMQHTFGVDVLACARCGGRMRVVATIDDPVVIRRILTHLGLPTAVPRRPGPRRLICSAGAESRPSVALPRAQGRVRPPPGCDPRAKPGQAPRRPTGSGTLGHRERRSEHPGPPIMRCVVTEGRRADRRDGRDGW